MRKKVKIGSVTIGGGYPVAIQSMCNIPFSRYGELEEQALALQEAGCEILRVSVPDQESASGLKKLKNALRIPLVADIHFDYRLALASIDSGADKIRINPGNIGGREQVYEVAHAAQRAGIPIRVGVNGGSLEKSLLERYRTPNARAIAESAFMNTVMLEDAGFSNIVVSMKSSEVKTMVESYRLFVRNKDFSYPLHVGVTEAGTPSLGLLKSAVGIGSLLLDGIGDTIRVSLTADPIEEVRAGRDILKAAGVAREGVEIISCPTCGRTKIDLISLAGQVEDKLADCKKSLKVAVMGCAVNGPGEAREADIGIAGGAGEALLFKKGEIVGKYPEDKILQVLLDEIDRM